MSSRATDALTMQEAAFERRDRLPLEVEVLRLEELLKPPFRHETTVPTRTRFHTLLLIEDGASSHHVDFEAHDVNAGDLMIIPQGRVQAFDRARAIRGYLALFTSEFVERCSLGTRSLNTASRTVLQSGLHVRLGETSRTRLAMDLATLARHTATLSSERFDDDVIAAAFALLLFSAAALPETRAAIDERVPEDELLARFEELLEAQFRRDHQAASYAAALRVSLRTLDRRLVAAGGGTARQRIAARLVLEAKRLLTRRETPIKHIAYELGFSEPQNFTRFMRARTGASPQAFRDSLPR